MARARQNRWGMAARIAPALALAVVAVALPRPAAAQFSWFGSGASSQDAYDTIAEHGFRLVRPMMQNRDVYIADVVDRSQRRQRLIISRESGQIVQRFMIDTGRGPYAALPGAPYGQALPPRPDGNVFDRIVRGFNDDATPRPPGYVGTPGMPDAVAPQVLPKPQRLTKPKPSDVEPKLATRHEDAPIASRPLAPEPGQGAAPAAAPPAPMPTPVKPAAPAAAVPPVDKQPPAATQAATPQPPAATPPAGSPPPARATVVTTDPLRIPGVKEADAPKPAATAAAAKPPAPTRPAPAKAPAGDVPVAPLD